MDTRFLESFVNVATHGSLAEAARRLGLTPAAVALRIKALEAEIGAVLLMRAGRTVRLTAAGEAVLVRAQELIRNVHDLRAIAADGEIAGELRLGAISTAITGLLPGVLSRVTELYPKLDLYVMPGTSIELYRKVLDGELDAALMVEPPFALPKTCDWAVLRQERLIVIAPEKLAHRKPLDLLTTEPFIRYDRAHWGGRLADHCLRKLGVKPRERFELDSLEAIAVLVDRGLGISLIPDWAPPWPEGLRLSKFTLPGSHPTRRIGFLWPRTSARAKLVRAFLDETKAAVAPKSGRAKRSTVVKKVRDGRISWRRGTV